MLVPRSTVRHGFTQPARITLLENDADNIESAVATAIEGLKEFVADEGKKLRSTMRWVIGSFFSVVLAIIAALAVLAFK